MRDGWARGVDPLRVEGRVSAIVGLGIRATMPSVLLGVVVEIVTHDGGRLRAEVVGFDGNEARLLPLGDARGVGLGDAVVSTGEPLSVSVSNALLGRVVDGLGVPIDGGPAVEGRRRALSGEPPLALERPRIAKPFVTGVRAIDGLATLGEGQRVGLFAGSGVGKSSLLAQIARNADADVFVVALVGERGREVREFLEDALGKDGLARGVVVVATSDAPPLVRVRAAETAMAVAEYFRDEGKHVVLLLDSLSRFARAGREVALAAGESNSARGIPPSVLAMLPALLERAGTSTRGAITAIFSVLAEADDLDEPVADEARSLLDGHLVLGRAIAERGRFPAIDVVRSLSRLMPSITTREHQALAVAFRAMERLYDEKRDLVTLGAYKRGSDAELDRAIAKRADFEAFLGQGRDESGALDETLDGLRRALS
jgi:FliI/YscN family ATPase